jgi:hypothetical protein
VQQVVDLELRLRQRHFLSTELILQLYQLVLKLDPPLSFVIQIGLKAVLRLSKLLTLILKHEFYLAEPTVILSTV